MYFLDVINKTKNLSKIQSLEEKKILLFINADTNRLNLKLKTQTSPIEVFINFSKKEELWRGRYEYEIKIEDAGILMHALKS